MGSQPGHLVTTIPSPTILSISPVETDHESLREIAIQSNWRVLTADRLPAARALLQIHDIGLVLCDCELQPGSWKDVLEQFVGLPHPPSLIVTSRFADDRLWAEALSLGAWDVLAKPLNRSELVRSVNAVWRHRHDRCAAPVALLRSAN